jgi:hypothetical protein
MTLALETPEDVARLFTGAQGYCFARWGRPLVPVVFGVQDATLATLKGALQAVAALAGHPMADQDPDLGANLMVFFCRDWDDLAGVPNLDRLVDGLPGVLVRLQAQGATQYRMVRFDEAGAIRACFVFLRMDAAMAALPAEVIALDLAVRAICLWADGAFPGGVLVQAGGHTVLHPGVAALIRAAYDPVLPAVARDPAHALRLFARMRPGGA